jgi:hypothetical protein
MAPGPGRTLIVSTINVTVAVIVEHVVADLTTWRAPGQVEKHQHADYRGNRGNR